MLFREPMIDVQIVLEILKAIYKAKESGLIDFQVFENIEYHLILAARIDKKKMHIAYS